MCRWSVQVLNFVRVAVQSHKVNLVSMDRQLGADTLHYELPVDAKLQEFTISISGENPSVTVLDPQGTRHSSNRPSPPPQRRTSTCTET